ncbi:MAG: rhomboid family intramembrane serine protease [Lachnospiraceae bacterium]|nr:rhomboid family intramembrane serine protease [Lachnospiraceae bacterium]
MNDEYRNNENIEDMEYPGQQEQPGQPVNGTAETLRSELAASPVTVILVATNIVVWAVLEIIGDTTSARFMLQCGGMWPDSVTYDHEYWRFLTCFFLHFGPTHLMNNMVLLFFLGREAERAAGHVRYLLIYLLSGLTGSTASYFTMVHSGNEAVAAGASGAIFGIMGLLAIVLLVHKGHYERFTMERLLLMVALSLYFGFTSGGIDNAGHIGGLCGGLVFGFLLYGLPFIMSSKGLK